MRSQETHAAAQGSRSTRKDLNMKTKIWVLATVLAAYSLAFGGRAAMSSLTPEAYAVIEGGQELSGFGPDRRMCRPDSRTA